jgi:hypothetical protein
VKKKPIYFVRVHLEVEARRNTDWSTQEIMDFVGDAIDSVKQKIDENPAREGRIRKWAFLSVNPTQTADKPDVETITRRIRGYYQSWLAKELVEEHQAELTAKVAAMPLPPDLEEAAVMLKNYVLWEEAVLKTAAAFFDTAKSHTTAPGSPQERSQEPLASGDSGPV